MTSFADSEKRLIAAFGRIDAALDRAAQQPPSTADATGQEAADNQQLDALRAEISALKRRLAEAHEETARLARANEALAQANSELTEGSADTESALHAEIDALKAARQAEIGALDEIMTGLEALISHAPRATDAPYAEDVTPEPADIVAFDKREG